MSFDWKTETDGNNWDDLTGRTGNNTTGAGTPFTLADPQAGELPSSNRLSYFQNRRAISLLAAIGLILALLFAVVYLQIGRLSAAGQQRAESELLASHDILWQAAREGDLELFTGFLSGRDPEWTEAVRDLARGGEPANRSNFGLMLLPAPTSPAITFAANLEAAELISRQDYAVEIGGGLTETITLDQTMVYRRGQEHWLLAPPETDFWGITESVTGSHARFLFPAHDAPIARRLARDIETVMAGFCAGLPDGCPPLSIRLSTDPSVLIGDFAPVERHQGGLEISLPAPTLFGTPIDEAAYRAVSRQYASRVVIAIIDDHSGWICCQNEMLYRALQAAQLHQLGLQPDPAGSHDYEVVRNDPAPLNTISQLWRAGKPSPDDDPPAALAPFVEFLVEKARATSVSEMQRMMVEGGQVNFWDWLSSVTGQRYQDLAHFERDWLDFAFTQ